MQRNTVGTVVTDLNAAEHETLNEGVQLKKNRMERASLTRIFETIESMVRLFKKESIIIMKRKPQIRSP